MRFHHIIIIIFLWCLLLAGQVGASQNKICTREEAMQVEAEASALKDWAAAYVSFKHFTHCNNENIIEAWGAYSDAVVRLLANDWKHFDKLVVLTSSDREFERFIIEHVSDETVPLDELQKIIKNARMHCPSKGKELCKKIEAAARIEP